MIGLASKYGWMPVVLAGLCLTGCQAWQAERKTFAENPDRLSLPCLEQLYFRCSREATERRMGSGEIAACSVVYEALLRRRFNGDFDALLAWSQQPEDDGASAASANEKCP